MKRPSILICCGIAFACLISSAHAQISLTGSPNPYTQNFNTYLGTLATVPAGWTVAFSGTATFNGVGTGTSATGGAWAYGTGGENSFGALRSATPLNITEAVSFTNNTGSTLTTLTITFNYEQWRYANTSGWDLSGTGALTGNALVNAADYVGLAAGTNGTPTSVPITLALTGLSIANGATFGLSWLTTDQTGSDNGVAIDDFSLTYSPVPEPSTWISGTLIVGLIGWTQRKRFGHLLRQST